MGITITTASTTVRCDSGYLLIGDPCYVLDPTSPDLRSEFNHALADPRGAVAVSGEGAAVIDTYGVLLPAPLGVHPVITESIPDYLTDGELKRVVSMSVRFDGGTEPLVFDDGVDLSESLSVDAGLMAVHDPFMTLADRDDCPWKTWRDFCNQVNTESSNGKEMTQGCPANPDGTDILAVCDTGYGDGFYGVSLFFHGKSLSGVCVQFIDTALEDGEDEH